MGKSEVFKDGRGEFRFRLKASNGETVASGRELCDAPVPIVAQRPRAHGEDVTLVDVK